MIGFFRKIRKKLADDNKPLKYMRYAVGEIALVVIGILIALQVNNWNEQGKLRIQEIEILKELKADLTQSLRDIKGDKYLFEISIKSNQTILSRIDSGLPYNDSLNYHFSQLYHFATFSINSSTFDNIRQTGSNSISNDSLRIKISDFYTSHMNLYKELESRNVIEHFQNYQKPMLISEFKTFDKNYAQGSMEPINYQAFIGNTDNRQIMNYTVKIYSGIVGYQEFLIGHLEKLITLINEEIELYEFD